MARFSVRLRQIDLLSRSKHSALAGLEIGRYSPQPQSDIERIDAERRPESELADPVLFRMAGGAQGNGVAITLARRSESGSSTILIAS
jgi:hypothetical protein